MGYQDTLKKFVHLNDYDNWPEPFLEDLTAAELSIFLRNQSIVCRVLAREKKYIVAREHGVSPRRVTQIMNRCLPSNQEHLPLTSGLIPNRILKPIERNVPLSMNGDIGARGSVDWILSNYQKITNSLDEFLLADLTNKRNGENVTPGRFFRRFEKLLVENNWPENQYPLDRVSRGRESIRKYYHKRREELRLGLLRRPKIDPNRPISQLTYRDIEIDEQTLDTTTGMYLEMGKYLKPIEVPRVSAVLARDVHTGCILDYVEAYTQHPSQDDILELLEKLNVPRKKRELSTAGVVYPPGGGFPSLLDKRVTHLSIGTVKLDNSRAHHANRVVDYICNVMCSSIRYGKVKRPKDRREVEHAFNLVTKLAKRSKSTVGSHPKDPLRLPRKKGSVPKISLVQFIDVLETYLAGINATRSERLGGHSPLETILFQLDTLPLAINFCPQKLRKSPYIISEPKKVYFLKNENRSPFINFQGMRYHGDCLHEKMLLGGAKIKIVYDVKDIRHLDVFSLEGVLLGQCYAPRNRQNTRLSIRTLSKIKRRNVKQGDLKNLGADGYFDALLADPDKNTLELFRVMKEIGSQVPSSNVTEVYSPSATNQQEVSIRIANYRKEFNKYVSGNRK